MKNILINKTPGERVLRTFFYLFFSVMLLMSNVSCEKQVLPEGPPSSGLTIVLDKENVELTVGDVTTIRLSLEDGKSFIKKFTFASSDPEIVGVEKGDGDGYTVKLTAREAGTAVIQLISEDNEVQLSCTVTVNDLPSDGILRILAIGNSFSEDALESYLHSIATEAGDSIVIGNMYIGGSSLEQHLTNANGNARAYSYRKIDKFGRKTTTNDFRLEDAIIDEQWDYISFQQASHFSGQFATYENTLPALFNYVKSKVAYSRTKFIFHQTWAYAQNSDHFGFPSYNSDQLTMYNAIMGAVQQAVDLVKIDKVVPAGTAIQNGRTSFWGDNFCRDGYHLDLNIGRYLAACTWYEALFGKSVIGNPYNPNSFMLSEKEMEMAQHAAHAAILKPYEITDMTDFKTIDVSEFTLPIFLNIAQQQPVIGWNGLTSQLEGTSIPFLRDKEGALTPVSLEVTERFNNVNFNGEVNTTTPFDMTGAVSGTSYFGNSKAVFEGRVVVKSVIKLSGFDPAKRYNLCFFGSRTTNEGRETKYITTGQNEVVSYLMTGSNKSNIACNDGVQPDANGNILVTVTAGERNDNGSGFYYLNAMRITPQ